MKVCMISTQFLPTTGGVTNHIRNLSAQLVRLGLSVCVLKPDIEAEDDQRYVLEGVEVHVVSLGSQIDKKIFGWLKKRSAGGVLGLFWGFMRKCYFNKFYRQVCNRIEVEHPDVNLFHQHDFVSSIVITKRLSKNRRIVLTNHTGEFLFLRRLALTRWMIPVMIRHFCHIFAPSRELLPQQEAPDRCTYLPNGVDLKVFDFDPTSAAGLKARMGYDPGETLIFCPRRWAPTKGVEYLAKAIPLVLTSVSPEKKVRFLFAGSDYDHYPHYRQKVMNILAQSVAEPDVVLLGDVAYEKMPRYMKAVDIVVIPSIVEATSLAMLEAMSCGKIVVATEVGGSREIVRPGWNGFLVKPKDVSALAKGLQIAIQLSSSEASRMGRNARRTVEDSYSWEIVAKEVLGIYLEALRRLTQKDSFAPRNATWDHQPGEVEEQPLAVGTIGPCDAGRYGRA